MDEELTPGLGEDSIMAEMNVTPFIDVMLVLLIIFMVTAPLMLGGARVNLPKASLAPIARPQNPVVVSLNAQNRVFVDNEEIPEAGRYAVFKRLARDAGGGEVYVRGDGEVKYARVMELMAELGRAGFARVVLVAGLDRAAPQAVGGPASGGE